mmetsp:Transcript_119798/g.284640  ORF Transcript_119798/g.284640 Transcript_119798/m.284640 type:complete len:89 (-) Transcript_119798:346-612(-)
MKKREDLRNKGSLRRSRSSNSCSQSTTSTRKRRREGGKMTRSGQKNRRNILISTIRILASISIKTLHHSERGDPAPEVRRSELLLAQV